MIELWNTNAAQTPTGLAYSRFLQLSEIVHKMLAEQNVTASAQSRLAQYDHVIAKLVRAKFGAAPLDNASAPVLARAVSELWQLAIISCYARSRAANPLFQEKARLLIKDAAIPEPTGTKPSPGRDTQFELFVVACWSLAGIQCELREPPGPDFKLTLGGVEVGLEAKRVKSIDSLPRRFAKAEDQLSNMENGGIIVTDLSGVVAQGQSYLVPGSPDASPIEDLEGRLKRLMASRIGKIGRKRRTFAWVGYCESLYLFKHEAVSFVYQWKNFNFVRGDDSRWLALVEVFGQLVTSGTRMLEDLSVITSPVKQVPPVRENR